MVSFVQVRCFARRRGDRVSQQFAAAARVGRHSGGWVHLTLLLYSEAHIQCLTLKDWNPEMCVGGSL